MHFAVLGTGDVGRVLATGLDRHGHDVTVGTRDPQKRPEWLDARAGIGLATFADAAAKADVAVLAVNWNAVATVLEAAGPHLQNKMVIDATNPLRFEDDGPPGLAVSGDDSAGETVQRALPHSQVVKCWNIVGHPYMVDPMAQGLPEAPTMFIAGDDRMAKEDVRALLDEVGWDDVVDLGGIEASRYLEAMCIAWVRVYGATGSGAHAFRLVRGRA